MDKRLIGLTLGGKDGYISGSELWASMKHGYKLGFGMKDNSGYALSTNKEAIGNRIMNLTECLI